MASGLGARPSLGYPGDKYEMGLEAIEEIEVIAAALCAEVFGAKYAEIAQRLDAIAFPGMTANFDAARSAALAVIGTPELGRWGMTDADADRLAGYIHRVLKGEDILSEVSDWRKTFTTLSFTH